jgi:hypothetical protein
MLIGYRLIDEDICRLECNIRSRGGHCYGPR